MSRLAANRIASTIQKRADRIGVSMLGPFGGVLGGVGDACPGFAGGGFWATT